MGHWSWPIRAATLRRDVATPETADPIPASDLVPTAGGLWRSSSPAAPTPQPLPGAPIAEGIYEIALAPRRCQGLPDGLLAAITSGVRVSAAGVGWTGSEAEEKHGRFDLRFNLATEGPAYVTGNLTGTITNQFTVTGPVFFVGQRSPPRV